MNLSRLLFASAATLTLGVLACGSDDTSSSTDGAGASGDGGQTLVTSSSSSTTTTSTASSSSTGTTGGGGGSSDGGGTASGGGGDASGGGGGAAATGGGGSAATGGGGDATGAGGAGGAATTADHLLITEVATNPDAGSFVEIYNPTAAAIDLGDYYFSDNGTYYLIAEGVPFNPMTSTPGTDFLVRFPSGASIGAGEVQTIGITSEFNTTHHKCPTYSLVTPSLATPPDPVCITTPLMRVPTNGGLDTMFGNLSDAREMVVVFTWDATTGHPVQDVDYVTWGPNTDPQARADKTADALYQPDTSEATQRSAPAPESFGQSIERCKLEDGEKKTGGNGITGHDETSEPLDVNFVVTDTPTPGVKSACLP